MSRILVVGSINQDIVIRVERRPNPGETVFGSELSYFPGGKGANQAVAAKRLGGTVTLAGKVGGDGFGSELRRYLAGFDLDNAIVVEPAVASGTAMILVDHQGENSIVVVPGANGTVQADDWSLANLCESGDYLVMQNEIPVPTTERLVIAAKQQGLKCIFNGAPAIRLADEMLRSVEFVVLNEHEFEVQFGAQPMLNNEELLAGQVRKFSDLFGIGVVLTLGSRGVIGVHREVLERVHGVKVQAVDTTGAGDCFVGGFTAELARGSELRSALEFANAAAALSVTKLGASSSFPAREEVERRTGKTGGRTT